MTHFQDDRPLVPDTLPMRTFWFRDPRMALPERGLLSFIVTHARGYKLTVAQMIAETKSAKDAVYSSLAKLVALNYVVRHQPRNDDGSFGEITYSYGPAMFECQYERNWGPRREHRNSDDSGASSPPGEETAAQAASGFSGSGKPASGRSGSGKPASGKPDTKTRKTKGLKPSGDPTNQTPQSPPEPNADAEAKTDGGGSDFIPDQNQMDRAGAVLDRIVRAVPVVRHPSGNARLGLVRALARHLAAGWHEDDLGEALSASFRGAGTVAKVLHWRMQHELGPPPPPPPPVPPPVPRQPPKVVDPIGDALRAAPKLDRDVARETVYATIAKSRRRQSDQAAAS